MDVGHRQKPSDATICGHVFCSFLALVLRDELFRRMDNAGASAEWDDILRDLNALTETAITYNGKTFVVRSNTVGVAGEDCPMRRGQIAPHGAPGRR